MLKSLRTSLFALLAIAAALAAPANAQQLPRPNESPLAMHPPNPAPQAAATVSQQELAAEKAAEGGTPEQREFARQVTDAMSNKDFAAMKALFAPSTLKCIGKHEDFLQDRIRKEFDLPISRKYKLTITKLPPNVMNPTKFATYPMRPTHLMGMQFTTPDGTEATVNLTIGQEDGKWYVSQPCPTELGMERFAKLLRARATQRERAKASMASVKDPVKSQLLALIGKHDSVGAWKLCMSSLNFDFPTCRGIVSILSGEQLD